jgi:hypothetical protein
MVVDGRLLALKKRDPEVEIEQVERVSMRLLPTPQDATRNSRLTPSQFRHRLFIVLHVRASRCTCTFSLNHNHHHASQTER